MKKLCIYLLLLPILSLFACDLTDLEDRDDLNEREAVQKAQQDAVAATPEALTATWEAYRLTDEGQDETYEIEGMRITLSSPDVMTATWLGNSQTGTWRLSNNQKALIIRMNTRLEPFEDLDDEWYIMQASATELHLHDPGERGGEWLYLRKVQ